MNIKAIIIFALLGLFSVLAGIFNWEFFFGSRRAKIFVNLFGRNGARIFYIVFGIIVIALGFLIKI